MKKILVLYVMIFMGLSLNAQPPINQWYSMGRDMAILGSIVVTDSCYYASGTAVSSVVPGTLDALFCKFDFNGNILIQKFLHSDTCSINSFGWTNLLQTFDTNFVTLSDFDESFLFIKYDPNGDTIFTTKIDEIYQAFGHSSVRPSYILQLDSDSSYMCLATVQNDIDYEPYLVLINISKIGSLNFYKLYNLNQPGFQFMYPRGIIEQDTGYLISCDIIKDGGGIDENNREHVRLIKVDDNGNEEWRWTDTDNLNDIFPFGLTQTPDGGLLYGGITGWFVPVANTQQYLAHVVKLDINLNRDWEIRIGDTTSNVAINCTQILDIGNNLYVATGYEYGADSMAVGWLINFNINGEVIWDSYFSLVPSTTSTNKPWHELYDVKQTPDKGFIMVGQAWDVQATFDGIPGKFAWLVKTDSVGCLVPGCQDFLEVENGLPPTIKLSTFPNPASNVLNIYYYDQNFSSKGEMLVYDINGNLIKSWNLFSNNMTYIYDVSTLVPGTYILKVVDGGIEKYSEKFVKI